MRKSIMFLWLLLFAVVSNTRGDEGMWIPSLIQRLNIEDMSLMGCHLTAEQIYSINESSLKDAVVSLNYGSCTASLISPDGLLLTNHHCAFGDIQSHSSVNSDYLRDGFWAMSREDELPNSGKTVSFLIRIEDVTDRVNEALSGGIKESIRKDRLAEVSEDIISEVESDTHYEAHVKAMFESNQYFLFVYETFRDVRLVGAPPKSIGKFGGDTDNWMWPRQTGDFCLYRVYCGSDGKPAEYSEENVPYKPRHYLPISLKGVSEGDFAMIMGYPGSTSRYRSSMGVGLTMDVTNEIRRDVREEKLRIIGEYMEQSQHARIQYSSKYARSSNYYKYSIGQNRGLKALNTIDRKRDIEREFTDWLDKNPDKKEKYGDALGLIESAYSTKDEKVAFIYMREAILYGPEIFTFAMGARPAYELLKENWSEVAIRASLEPLSEGLDTYFKDYSADTDQKLVAALLEKYAGKVAPKYYPDFFHSVNKKDKGNYSKYAESAFAKSIFADKVKLEGFVKNPKLKVLEKDAIFQAMLSISDIMDTISEDMDVFMDTLQKGRRLFVAGLMEMSPDRVAYPDANSTMRLTYGSVSGYQPRDGVHYSYFTTLKGCIEKEIPGDDEFDLPANFVELYNNRDFGVYADKDGSLRTCFITNNDITGGNSGSPVINGDGELIGCAFDGNWEAMSGDIAFEPDLQRCINVDARYIIWVIDKFAGARHLIDEMTIVR